MYKVKNKKIEKDKKKYNVLKLIKFLTSDYYLSLTFSYFITFPRFIFFFLHSLHIYTYCMNDYDYSWNYEMLF